MTRQIRRRGSFAPLSANYYKDDALDEAGLEAELLFVRGLAFCAETLSDGVITARQVVRFVGVGMTDPLELAARLVKVDVWREVDGGFLVRSWLDWNPSRDEIRGAQEKDRNRKRRSEPSGGPQAPTPTTRPADTGETSDGIQTDSARNPDGVQTDSTRSRPANVLNGNVDVLNGTTDSVTADAPTLFESDAPRPQPTKRATKATDADPPGFPEFWAACPRKVGKGAARTAFVKAGKRSDLDAATLAARMAVWAVHWQREGRAENYIPHPSTWLNESRYDDPPPTYLPARRGPDQTANGGLGQGTTAERVDAILSLKRNRRHA